jgi:hypothetical protein
MTKPCETPCPKCGAADIIRRFYKKDEKLGSRWGDPPLPGGYGTGVDHYYASRDLIHHHCRTCQYGWVDKPLPRAKRAADQSFEPQEAK